MHKKYTSQIGVILKKSAKTLSVAESCTGGLVGHEITNIPGSSDYFSGGVIAYSNKSKSRLLGVSAGILEEHGAVSVQVAKEMANGCRKVFNSDYAAAVTGIAGPSGGTKEKPVGLVYIAVAGPRGIYCKKFIFKGTRLRIKHQACRMLLRLCLEYIGS